MSCDDKAKKTNRQLKASAQIPYGCTDAADRCALANCDAPLKTGGKECAQGHSQGPAPTRLLLRDGMEVALAREDRPEPPYPGVRLVTNCPECGAQMIARFEPNVSLSISLNCTQCKNRKNIGYRQLANFEEVVGDRIITADQVDDQMYRSYSRHGDTAEYIEIGGKLYRVWRAGGKARFEEVPVPQARPGEIDPIARVVQEKFSKYDPCGSPFEEYFDAFYGPFWTLHDHLGRENWPRVNDLFSCAEERSRRLWHTSQPEEVARRLIEAGSWQLPTEEDLAGDARQQAVREATLSHKAQVEEQHKAWLDQKQVEFDAWREEALSGLVQTTAYPKAGQATCALPEWVKWEVYWPAGLKGTGYTTGDSYSGIDHPQAGFFIHRLYGNAAVAYTSPEQAQRWRMQEWEEKVAKLGEADAAWEVLRFWGIYSENVYGGDVSKTIVETIGADELAAMARQKVRRVMEGVDLPSQGVEVAEQYDIEVRVMAPDDTIPTKSPQGRDLRQIGFQFLWRDPEDGTLWGTTFGGEWAEIHPVLSDLEKVNGRLALAIDEFGTTSRGVLHVLRVLTDQPNFSGSTRCRNALNPLGNQLNCSLASVPGSTPDEGTDTNLIGMGCSSVGEAEFSDGSRLEVWTVSPQMQEQKPLAVAVLRDPKTNSVWTLVSNQDLPRRMVGGVAFQPWAKQGQPGAASYNATVSPTDLESILPFMSPGDRISWGEPSRRIADDIPYYDLLCMDGSLRLVTHNVPTGEYDPELGEHFGDKTQDVTLAETLSFLRESYGGRALDITTNPELVERAKPMGQG